MSKRRKTPKWKRALLDWVFNALGRPLLGRGLRLLARSVRLDVQGRAAYDQALAAGRPIIFAFWHEDLIGILLSYLRLRPGTMAVMVSRSRDGEKLAAIMQALNVMAVRGSSSRGGVAGIVELLHWLNVRDVHDRACHHAALALDGPRGPRRQAKPGIALLAEKSRALVLPCAVRGMRQSVFRSWDRTRLPHPLTRLRCVFGEPLTCSPGTDRELFTAQLGRRLEALQEQLETPAPTRAKEPPHA